MSKKRKKVRTKDKRSLEIIQNIMKKENYEEIISDSEPPIANPSTT